MPNFNIDPWRDHQDDGGNNALEPDIYCPPMTITRTDMIEECVFRARRPLLAMRAIRKLEGNNGNWYCCGGFPSHVKFTGETKIVGYAMVADNGTTIGKLYQTEQAGIDSQNTRQRINSDDFRSALVEMSDPEVQSQYDYWTKA